uniref:DDE Tnp4 domain-containing protein n=1 Tax=Chenopodium quinoa TaxID=63459 RepID=A0A803L5I7_CHEQI
MNVLGVCAPNMQFIYVLPGWEGSAHDMRVLRNALSRPNGFRVSRVRKFMPTDDINEDELSDSDDDSESDSDDEREFITSMEASQAKGNGKQSRKRIWMGWDAEKKMLQVGKAVIDEWVKTHKKSKGLFGVPFIHYETLAEIYAKDKATRNASESFVDAIEDMDQEIDKQPFNVESDEEDDVKSTHSDTYSYTSQSGKRPIKIEDDHSTPSEMAKVKASTIQSSASDSPTRSGKRSIKAKEVKVKGKNKVNLKRLCRNDDDDLVASLHDVSNNFGKIFENINVNLRTMASAWSKVEERIKGWMKR